MLNKLCICISFAFLLASSVCIVEEKTIKVRFKEDKRKSYSIEWSELLNLDETPLASIDEANPGKELLAPYYDGDNAIKYAVAKVLPLSVSKKQQGKIIDVL